ncbi:MAG: enoyl-CoA hydratase-related protein, partial [Zavarzinia sp.]|nr:enoyl-CoA hydratase-related protein [Zavarzinia sp.]
MTDLPTLNEFRIEPSRDGIIHLVFDMPGRTMNVFSNAAIHELGQFAGWLKASDVRGVVLRSGKATAFCAGADLNELGVAYDMIMASPKAARGKVAFDHFFPLSQGLRALETAGKPVAAAIDGLALGGGCEFALAAHYRVVTDSPRTALGLPESLVGLLPGAGGTQRLPRLIGIAGALPVLLDGKRIGPAEALSTGLVQAVVASGEEVAAAEAWILSDPDPRQPWDQPDWRETREEDVRDLLDRAWAAALADPGEHYPAPFAILDCIRGGIVKPMDRAIEWEMDVFSRLIQRPEPRNMIQSLFLGKLEHDKRAKAGTLPPALDEIEAEILGVLRFEVEAARAGGTGDATISDALDSLGLSGLLGRIEG